MKASDEAAVELMMKAPSPRARVGLREMLGRVGRLFPRNPASEAVATVVRFDATPEAVWQGILFYEEVPRRPLWFLRVFLPRPVRTEGRKTEVGALIRCTYDGGLLIKRITAVEPARLVRFEVLEQRLGVDDCVSMGEGSYEIRRDGDGSEVVLTTWYRGHLRPRWLWRPLERYLGHAVHRHILEGMRATLAPSSGSSPPALGRAT